MGHTRRQTTVQRCPPSLRAGREGQGLELERMMMEIFEIFGVKKEKRKRRRKGQKPNAGGGRRIQKLWPHS